MFDKASSGSSTNAYSGVNSDTPSAACCARDSARARFAGAFPVNHIFSFAIHAVNHHDSNNSKVYPNPGLADINTTTLNKRQFVHFAPIIITRTRAAIDSTRIDTWLGSSTPLPPLTFIKNSKNLGDCSMLMAPFESSDEGEIIETSAQEDLKATSLPKHRRSSVDRTNRLQDGYSRSRSPDRNGSRDSIDMRSHSPRGYKRSRQPSVRDPASPYSNGAGPRRSDRDRSDVEYLPYSRGRDPRRFQVRYEDSLHYDDGDSHDSRASHIPRSSIPMSRRDTPEHDDWYRDRDLRRGDRNHASGPRQRSIERRPEKRPRHRSRSPRFDGKGGRSPFPDTRSGRGDYSNGAIGRGQDDRSRRGLGFDGRHNGKAPNHKYGEHGDRTPRGQQWSSRPVNTSDRVLNPDAKTAKGHDSSAYISHANNAGQAQSAQDAYVSSSRGPAVANQTSSGDHMKAEDPEPEAEPIDVDAEIERRRRRRDELLAKSRGATPMFTTNANTPLSAVAALAAASGDASAVASPRDSTPARDGTPGTQDGPTPPALDIFNDQELVNTHADPVEDGPSAANYDPTADMREDLMREAARHGNAGVNPELQPEPEAKEEATKGGDEDDDFDMFADDFDEEKYTAPRKSAATQGGADASEPGKGGILEGDDKDGYYKIRIGEVLNGRYKIETTLGKGMFSGVARARDTATSQAVAIKIMRNNDALRKGGFTEIAILQKINRADPDNRKHMVKFERHFDYKSHLCMVFENLSLNLREVLRKVGNNVGLNLTAVRVYARQMFLALAHLKACSIVHADLKPDNILVNESRNVLKICDLGTAIDRSDAATAHNDVTPYLVSRFYRAPEIMLGMPYDYAVDVWSIGCTLSELYTGKFLFTGDSNNQMLKSMMEIRGKMSSKLYRRGQLWQKHFDDKGNFISYEPDKLIPGKTVVKVLPAVKPTRDIRTRVLAASTGMNDDETKLVNHFIDLLERSLALNPDRRMTPNEALKHPFFLHHTSRR
ncbi:hypothetical protein MKZ38_001691 [Zalerion maritima]|uniref:non-specific serine/threonine protein kinase n=1 Tax=Zalerion maritima TaxID=339359 RepID=A0AAD5WT04_9PEZI|nr:hypothetical protein MKZ38_001691 [Zalerion maritima]